MTNDRGARRPSSVEIRQWHGDPDELQQAAVLFGRVFTEPPYHEDAQANQESFVHRCMRDRDHVPDWRLVLAWEDRGLVGLALGSGSGGENWWLDWVREQLDRQQTPGLEEPMFIVAELAVLPEAGRLGVAAGLMEALLADLPYSQALLGCDASATAAVTFYTRTRWSLLGEIPSGHGGLRMIMRKRL